MDRSAIAFIGHGKDDIRKIGLCGDPVVFGGDGRMFRVAMVNAEQGPFVVEGVLFGGQVVDGRDLEAAGLVALFGVVDDEDVDDDARPIGLFPTEQKAAAFIGECVECVVDEELFNARFDYDHIIAF